MAEAAIPIEAFCCYSRKDEPWLRKLETHLSLLKRQGLISFWHDRLIAPGIDWTETIDAHLETASVILLLVSADFLASDYCYSIEMKRALERQADSEARVVPILVRQVDWKDAPFAHLQVLPTNAKPIASWRNQDRALADVSAGIRRVIEDVPFLAASAPRSNLPAIWNIPYPRNPFFLGRDDELTQLRSHLQADQATALSQPQAISGLGGIGKTQLALEYAYRYHQDYQVVLWARAESTEALASSYIGLTTLLRLPECEAREQAIMVQAVKTWLQTHRDWLLILDNADELTLLPDFLPPRPGGHLLLTTRAAGTGRLAHKLEIETLLPEHSALFLLRRAALIAPDAELSQAPPQERDLALQISQELGGLPLALDQAGAYLEETGMALANYWQLYQRHRADLLRERRGLVADHPAPVATTWSLSFQRVEERNPAASDLLRMLAFLAPDAIPEEILTVGAAHLGPMLTPVASNIFLLNSAIEALRAYSLVQRDPWKKTLSVHRLVQAVLIEYMAPNLQKQWRERVVRALNAAFPEVRYFISHWSQCERLLSHALVCAMWTEDELTPTVEVAKLFRKTGNFLHHRLQHSEAETLLERTLSIYEQYVGVEDLSTATVLLDLALLYHNQDKNIQAEHVYLRALAIQEKLLGADHPDTVFTRDRMTTYAPQQIKYEQIELWYQQALSILDKPLELWYQQALSIYDKPRGAAPPLPHLELLGLALFLRERGMHEQAGTLYQRLLSIMEPRLEATHPFLQGLKGIYADFLYSVGRDTEAAALEMNDEPSE